MNKLTEQINNPKPIQKLWLELTKKKECIYCSKRFEDGIVKKHPNKGKFILSAFDWFTSEYLVHCQTTHGLEPDDITMFLEKLNK